MGDQCRWESVLSHPTVSERRIGFWLIVARTSRPERRAISLGGFAGAAQQLQPFSDMPSSASLTFSGEHCDLKGATWSYRAPSTVVQRRGRDMSSGRSVVS